MIMILFILSTIGMTNILIHGKILDDEHLGWRSFVKQKLGKYKDVLECHECTGWWCGLILGLFLLSTNFFVIISAGFAGAGIMHAYIGVMNFIESKTDFILEGEHEEQPE